MATLNYVNIFARDIKNLSKFYMDVFDFEEIRAYRSLIFRGIQTGKCAVGFSAQEAYELLNLKDQAKTKGVKFLLNFEARSMKEVDLLAKRAVRCGATAQKEPHRTNYNWYQAVLLDPEADPDENAGRLAHPSGTGRCTPCLHPTTSEKA